jgi:dihydrofolate reductase
MALADEQVISEIPLSAEGDVRYPELDRDEWEVADREPHDGYTVVTWRRR